MFEPVELKLIYSTLSQRRAWLQKTIGDDKTADSARVEHQKTLKIIDSSLKKLATLSPPKTKVSAPSGALAKKAIPKARKVVREDAVTIESARILVAEDNEDSALLLQGVLEDMGCTKIDVVENGLEAKKAMERCDPPYDIVLCDWDMPEINGLEAIRAVKSLVKLRFTHFVMVTAISEAARIKEAVVEGVHDYIVKPIDADVLEKKIKAALEGNALKAAEAAEKESSDDDSSTPAGASLLKKS